MLPMVGLLSKLLIHWIPEKTHKEMPHLTSLDIHMLDAPAIGIEQSQKEIAQMGNATEKMMDLLLDTITKSRTGNKKAGKTL